MGIVGSSLRKVIPAKAVDKIINCTDTVMYVYGTSGVLLKLAPRVLDLSKVRLHNKGIVYAVDGDTEDQLLQIDRKFASIIVHPNWYGNGKNHEDIYKFSQDRQPIIPITDNYGKSGDKIYR